MRKNRSSRFGPLTRVAFWVATTSLCLSTPWAGFAQPAPPDSAIGGDAAGEPDTNPPAIAGSLAAIAGTVSFHAAGETQWSQASLNYPVTNGEGFWTQPQASATIAIADDKVVLDESTEFDVTTLDQSQFVATEAQGAVFFQLNSLQQGQTLAISTPRGTVQINQAGQYELVAGDTNDATTVTVVSGAAHITATNLSLDIGPNQTATISGSDTLQGSVGPLQADAFLQNQLAQTQQQQQAVINIPQECRYMTGGRQLAAYGSFTQTAQYGQIWYPNDVPTGWAPYRDGHWAYVAPWGWTWIDNAQWGFAPFHYGRWAQIDGRWGWLPGGGAPYVAGTYPIYSPALVAFVGVGAASLGFGGGEWVAGGYAPAWVPLGPREPYYPWYHFREGYFARINSFYGVPHTIIERGPTYYNSVSFRETNIFINRRAATVVPPAVFARGQSVMAIGRALPEHAFAEARPLAGRLPVRPTALTPNLPPEAARRYSVTVPARPLHTASGPRITPPSPSAHPMPELRHVALPANVQPAPAATRPNAILPPPRPGAATPSATHGLPTLRAPGARPEAPNRPAAPSGRGPAEVARPGTTKAPVAEHEPETSRMESGHSIKEKRTGEPHEAPHGLQSHDSARPVAHTEISRPVVHEPARRQERPEAARSEPIHREAPRSESKAEPHPPTRDEVHPAHHDEKHPPHR